MEPQQQDVSMGSATYDETLFESIAHDLESQGFSVRPSALPSDIANELHLRRQNLSAHKYEPAGIGRGHRYLKTELVRTDEIYWIKGDSTAGEMWLAWAASLQRYLNRRLFLGLFSFESHFAHYAPGDYYKRHYDAFRGERNRILSIVTYLNPGWQAEDAGELVLYKDDQDKEGVKVAPLFGTVVAFLSEEFPHEVLKAKRDRYSVAGWFRVNASIDKKIDPPR